MEISAKGGSMAGKWSLAFTVYDLYLLGYDKVLVSDTKTAPKNPALEVCLAARKVEMAKNKGVISIAKASRKLPYSKRWESEEDSPITT